MFNKKEIKLFLYFIVGVIATIAEWGAFYFTSDIGKLHYLPATIIAYSFSTFINWMAGRLILFKNRRKIFCLKLSVSMPSA